MAKKPPDKLPPRTILLFFEALNEVAQCISFFAPLGNPFGCLNPFWFRLPSPLFSAGQVLPGHSSSCRGPLALPVCHPFSVVFHPWGVSVGGCRKFEVEHPRHHLASYSFPPPTCGRGLKASSNHLNDVRGCSHPPMEHPPTVTTAPPPQTSGFHPRNCQGSSFKFVDFPAKGLTWETLSLELGDTLPLWSLQGEGFGVGTHQLAYRCHERP